MMKAVVACVLLALACVDAHTYLSSVTVDGTKHTDCLRPLGTNSPISSVTSNDMMCGFLPQGAQPSSAKCKITAGSKIGFQWNHNSPDPSDDIVDGSHKGPCLVYLSSDNGVSWFKIYENGYNNVTNTFCVTTLIANRGYMEATIPSDIAPGNYLVRAEIIALHEAFDLNKAQPYVDCAELTISGSGSAKPPTVKIPGAYSPNDPGIHFNIYASPMAPYIIPGPPVYVSGKSGSSSGSGSGSGSGYGNDDGNTKSSSSSKGGMTAGGKVVLIMLMLGIAVGVACGVYFYRANGNLFGYSYSPSQGLKHVEPRKTSNYVAFVDDDKL